jgi:cellulose synthase/poly-beta-1,6-N-acetylglucosamine synthase-like glycosyltransferase
VSVQTLGDSFAQLGIPIGGILVGAAIGALLFITVELLRRRPQTERQGNIPVRLAGKESLGRDAEGRLTSVTANLREIPVHFPGGQRTILMTGVGDHPSLPMRRALGFMVVLALTFAISAVVLLLKFTAIFGRYDHLVALVGVAIYWPLRWPGVYAIGANTPVVPDFIFPMYLAGMIAFSVAFGLWTNRPARPLYRRGLAVAVFLAYIAVEMILDALLFTVPGSSFRNFGLVLRSLNGGLFLAFLIFCAVHLPPAQRLPIRFRRDRGAIRTFVLAGVGAIVLAFAILVGLGLVFSLAPVLMGLTTLLLLPTLALEVYALLTRPLYARELRTRPLPPVSEYHPSVSILIPAYNEEAFIEESIESADRAASVYPGRVEIIVGNDGSTDRTLEIARRSVDGLRHSRGVVADFPHGGKSSALNGALALATGEIVIRCDGDTQISPEQGFAAMIPHFADPQVGAVQGGIHPRQRRGWTRKLRALEVAWNHYLLRPGGMATRTAEVVDGLFSAFRRKDLVEAGGWIPWNGEDTEISIRLQRMGYRTRIEYRALAFEDVPANYDELRKQRVRWARGIVMANGQHYPALLGPTPEFAGLGIFLWFLLFVHSGMRSLIYLYLSLLILVLGVPSLVEAAVILLVVLTLRAVPLAYFLAQMGRRDVLWWIPFFPIGNVLKQTFRFEAFGTLGPDAVREYA